MTVLILNSKTDNWNPAAWFNGWHSGTCMEANMVTKSSPSAVKCARMSETLYDLRLAYEIAYSWIQHPVGFIHAILRTSLVVSARYAFPAHRLLTVPLVIVMVYLVSLIFMVRRPIPSV